MKRMISFLLAAFLLLTCGCSLAQPAPDGETHNGDRLVGVLVTTEYLDLFDMEAWLSDNIDKVNIGETTEVSGDTAKYEGRIYAEKLEKQADGSDGKSHTLYEWQFPDELENIIGGLFICPTVTDPENGEEYTSSFTRGHIYDAHTHIKSTDAGDSMELTCTVYFDPYAIPKETSYDMGMTEAMDHIVFYSNPVYQTSDGAVYVTSGMGHSYTINSDIGIDSFRSSSTLKTTHKTAVNGEASEVENIVTINYEGVRMAQSISVLEMSAGNKLLRTQNYAPTDFPKEITVEDDTAYIIVETRSVDSEGNKIVSRQICSADHPDESFEVFIPAEKGYAIKQTTKVVTQ